MTLIPASQPACWSAVDAGALQDQELVSGLQEIVVAENALSSLKLRVLAQIETRGLARQLGSKTTGDWLGGTGTINPGTAKRMVRTALGLEALPTVADAVRGGDISFEHAAAVVTAMAAIDAVAPDLDESVRAAAVETLLAVARVHAPYLVAEKGRDLVLRFRPCETDIPAEDVSRNSLELSRTRSGRIRLVGDLDAVTGEMLTVALSPLSKPAPAADGTPDERTPAQRRADALTRLLELYLAAGTGPTEGGVRPHIVLTVHARDLAAARAAPQGPSRPTAAPTRPPPTPRRRRPTASPPTSARGRRVHHRDVRHHGARGRRVHHQHRHMPATGTSTSVRHRDLHARSPPVPGTSAKPSPTPTPRCPPPTRSTTDAPMKRHSEADTASKRPKLTAARRAAPMPTLARRGDRPTAPMRTAPSPTETCTGANGAATAQDATPDPARFCEPAPFRLEWMGAISTELAQMLACDCTITSIVLDDHEVPLTLGRTQRLVPPSLRRAVVARDVGCVRCGAAAAWSQCHHIAPWSEGGPTDLTNIALVCGRCHRELHRGYWDLAVGQDGHVWIIPPKRIDKHRKPVPGFFRRAQQEEVA